MLCHALDATGLKDYRDRPRRRLAVPGPDGEPGRARGRAARPARGARAARLRRARPRRWRPRGSPARPPSCCSSVPQRRGGPEVLADTPAPAEEAVTGLRSVHELLEPRGRRAGDLRPRPGAQHRLLHGRRVRRLRPRARRADRRRRALRRAARPLRAARCPRSASRSASTACTSRSPARSAAPGALLARSRSRGTGRMTPHQRPHDRGSARRAVHGHRRPARRRSGWTPRSCARTTASCCSRTSA